MKTLFVVLQYLLPQHLLSRLMGRLAECEVPWVKQPFIDLFVTRYGVDMSEAAEPETAGYPNFNAFFTRALKPGARPLPDDPEAIVSPADGAVSQAGAIGLGRIVQAKGQTYSVAELLGGDDALAERWRDGLFATIYLAPRDYHRVHMPLGGVLESMTYVPGRLFSVNPATADNVPRLFARNERVVTVWKTDAGPMAVVLVGAMIVAGIDTVWAGPVAPPRHVNTIHYRETSEITLATGAEMGRFRMGSTVVVLLPAGVSEWAPILVPGARLRMGEAIGTLRRPTQQRA